MAALPKKLTSVECLLLFMEVKVKNLYRTKLTSCEDTLFIEEDHYARFVLCTNGITKQAAVSASCRIVSLSLSLSLSLSFSLVDILIANAQILPTNLHIQCSNHFSETALTFFNALILFICLSAVA